MELKNPTPEEILLEEALRDEGLNITPQFSDKELKVVDLRSVEAKVDIEVDGLQHLLNPIQINRDLDRSYYSQKDGYTTLHVPNREVHTHLKKIAHSIAVALKYRIKRMKFKFKKHEATKFQ